MGETENPAAKTSRMNAGEIEELLKEAARQGKTFSYSELLLLLDFSFTRPKMRALCKILDAIDLQGRREGRPELACLVVREEDSLPGQGWWQSRLDFVGEWESHAARRYLKDLQKLAFEYWQAEAK